MEKEKEKHEETNPENRKKWGSSLVQLVAALIRLGASVFDWWRS